MQYDDAHPRAATSACPLRRAPAKPECIMHARGAAAARRPRYRTERAVASVSGSAVPPASLYAVGAPPAPPCPLPLPSCLGSPRPLMGVLCSASVLLFRWRCRHAAAARRHPNRHKHVLLLPVPPITPARQNRTNSPRSGVLTTAGSKMVRKTKSGSMAPTGRPPRFPPRGLLVWSCRCGATRARARAGPARVDAHAARERAERRLTGSGGPGRRQMPPALCVGAAAAGTCAAAADAGTARGGRAPCDRQLHGGGVRATDADAPRSCVVRENVATQRGRVPAGCPPACAASAVGRKRPAVRSSGAACTARRTAACGRAAAK
jgi:hypothetical protein